MLQARTLPAFAGAVAWFVGALQFFIIQVVAGAAWPTGYSWSANNISDLGWVHCRHERDPTACSPLHDTVNISFVATGALLAFGTLAGMYAWQRKPGAWVAGAALLLAAFGWILVGIHPSDVDPDAHVLGAFGVFVLGNTALLAMGTGVVPGMSRALRIAAPILGGIGLVAAALFISEHYLGLGRGGMERFVVFGQLVWTFAFGCALIVRNSRRNDQHRDQPRDQPRDQLTDR